MFCLAHIYIWHIYTFGTYIRLAHIYVWHIYTFGTYIRLAHIYVFVLRAILGIFYLFIITIIIIFWEVLPLSHTRKTRNKFTFI
jgi:hypothetical protein